MLVNVGRSLLLILYTVHYALYTRPNITFQFMTIYTVSFQLKK
jgi:hypothetical protein